MLRGCLTISFLQVGKFSIFLASTKKLSQKLFFFCSSFFPFHLPALSGSNCFVSSHFVCSLHYNPLCKPLGNPSFSSSPGLSRLRPRLLLPQKLSFHSKPEPGEAGTFHKVQLEFGRNKKRWSRFMVISLAAIKATFSGTPKDLRARCASVWVTKRKERESEKSSSEKSQLELCLLRKVGNESHRARGKHRNSISTENGNAERKTRWSRSSPQVNGEL